MSQLTSSNSTLFTDDIFESHLSSFSDVAWLQDLKRRHWQDFQLLPMPTRQMERWRFTRLARLTLNGVQPVAEAPADAVSRLMQHLELSESAAARVGVVDNALVLRGLELPAGVEVLTLREALAAHPERIRSYLEARSAALGMDKFFALHMAFLSEAVVVRVPRGVVVEHPIEVHFLAARPRCLLLPHTLLLAEENSQVTLVEYHGSLAASGRALAVESSAEDHSPTGIAIGVGTVHTGRGAVVKRVIVQNHASGFHCYQSEEATAERDTSLESTAINLGGSYARLEGHAIAAGAGADVHLYSLAAPTGSQVFDQRTLQTHRAGNARSDLLFKNALLAQSQTIFSGMIIVEENAQQTDAYQTNNNLLLSPTAEANSLPGLEIEANDVKCSHGATTGQVSPEELFYLKARGIPERAAFELLVNGFFEEVLGKIRQEDIHQRLSAMVQSKVAGIGEN